jgi:hypothetical protein
MAQVFNDNEFDYEEMFKGDLIKVPAKGSIEMEWEDAVQFAGQFGKGVAPPGPNGKPDPRYFKMIRVPYPKRPVVGDDELTNHATGKKASSVSELTEALKEFAGQRAGENDEITALKTQLAEQRELLAELIAERKTKKAGKAWQQNESASPDATL